MTIKNLKRTIDMLNNNCLKTQKLNKKIIYSNLNRKRFNKYLCLI